MELYLLRHGVAYNADKWTGDSDDLRPLTDAGIAAMEREAAYLRTAKVKIDKIISSPLVRTRQTGDIVGKALGIKPIENPLLRPGFNYGALEKLLKEYADVDALMLVGHAPDMSDVIAHVIGGGMVEMLKGGLAHLHILRRNPPTGTLYSLLPPEALGA